MAAIGDVDGDGVGDLALGAPGADEVFVLSGANRSVIHTIADPDGESGFRFGHSVVGVGDVDGDGVEDIGVGARGDDLLLPLPCVEDPCAPDPLQGRAFVFSGATASLIHRLQPVGQFLAFGYDVEPLGDVNADGVPDIAVGSPTRRNNSFGQVFAFSGADASQLWVTREPDRQDLASFGQALAAVGDLNGDGKTDLLVGAPFHDNDPDPDAFSLTGRAYVLSGSDGTVFRAHDNPLGLDLDIFGAAVSGIGDQDGDAREEYAVGKARAGAVCLFRGGDGSLIECLSSPGDAATDFFGFPIARTDDYDGDGHQDFWVGASRAGRVYLLNDSGTVLLEVTDPTPPVAPPAEGGFGWRLAITTDLGGDPQRDLMIGEPAEPVSGLDGAGAAHLVLVTANRPPVADAGPDQTVECARPDGTPVTLDASASSDPDGDSLSFEWRDAGDVVVATDALVELTLPLGVHTFTLTVDDGKGGTDSDAVVVTVEDTTPPTLSIALSPNVLWPANHKLVEVTASVHASDACDLSPSVSLVAITSSEPDDGLGDGDTHADIQGVSVGADDRSFFLRAERSAAGTGRVYSVTYQAVDASGNVAIASATVTVPRDRGRRP